jgi:hypothetical protein
VSRSSKSTYRHFYKKFNDHFIDVYCAARKNGYSGKSAFVMSKIKLQELVVKTMAKNTQSATIILRAYSNIRNDQELYEKSISYFKKYN